ncbi:MAG: GNAT family N-acetyltransferase [Flavobacteriia bacterium]|jgi:GNAT superfamily N-acetyltransferase|nr:GNAT family N-acetyltransferase [Flavobacteriia bacterium]
MLTIRELTGKQEMMCHITVLNAIYPSLTVEEYDRELDQMLQHNYGQVAVFDDEICIGISGFWIGTKLWCGKYLELDNIVVLEKYRSKGVGKLLFDFLHKKAVENDCTMLSLDSYTHNFKAHKFFYNQGFSPKGFHFISILKPNKVR